jgi:hypothetical protein
VPADAIKDLKPVMTMVGGKTVYERLGWVCQPGRICDPLPPRAMKER